MTSLRDSSSLWRLWWLQKAVHHCGQYSISVGWWWELEFETEVSTCSVTVYLMVQRAIRSPANIYILEGKVAHFFPSPWWTECSGAPRGPDDESVIQVKELAEGHRGYPAEHCFLKVLCEEAGDNRRQWWIHNTMSLFTEEATECKVVRICQKSFSISSNADFGDSWSL
jgi:hypothetical protein